MFPKAERHFRQTHPIGFFVVVVVVVLIPPPSPFSKLRTTKTHFGPLLKGTAFSIYPWIHTASIKGQEPITITFNPTKKGSHEKEEEGKKNKCGPKKKEKESKRHQPHTSGQCSFHSAYILALLWVRKKKKQTFEMMWLRYNKQTDNMDIRTRAMGVWRGRAGKTVPMAMCKEKGDWSEIKS